MDALKGPAAAKTREAPGSALQLPGRLAVPAQRLFWCAIVPRAGTAHPDPLRLVQPARTARGIQRDLVFPSEREWWRARTPRPSPSQNRRSRRPCGSIRLRRDPTTNPRLRLPGLPRLSTAVVGVFEAYRSRGQWACCSWCASAHRNRDHPSQSVPSHLPQPRAPSEGTAWPVGGPPKRGRREFPPDAPPDPNF